MKWIKSLFMLTIAFILQFQLYSTEYNSFSAEAERLGKNVISASGKPYIMFSNPAGLHNLAVPAIFADYGLLYPNLTDGTKFVNNTIGYAQPIFGGGLGIGVNQFGVKDWYQCDTFVLSYGRAVKEYLPQLKLGTKVSMLKESYVLDDYMKQSVVFSKFTEKSVFNFSLGLQYEMEQILLSAVMNNLLQPDLGFYTQEILPIEIELGGKYTTGKLNLYFSATVENNVKKDYTTSFSIEYGVVIFKQLKILPSVTVSFGSRNYSMIHFGFSVQTKQVAVGYSYTFDPLQKVDTGGQTRVSISYNFLPVEVEQIQIPKKELEKLVKEKEELTNQIKTLQEELQKVKLEKKELPAPVSEPVTTTEKIVSPEEELQEKIKLLEEKLKELEKKKPATVTQPTTAVSSTVTPTTKKRYHTAVPGDTLPKLAEKYYGDASQWKKIYEANKDKIIRGQIVPGSVLEIP